MRAWNRTRDRADPLAADGATVAPTPARGGGRRRPGRDDAQRRRRRPRRDGGGEGALAGASDDALWVQASTIGLDGTERCAELAERHGVDLPLPRLTAERMEEGHGDEDMAATYLTSAPE